MERQFLFLEVQNLIVLRMWCLFFSPHGKISKICRKERQHVRTPGRSGSFAVALQGPGSCIAGNRLPFQATGTVWALQRHLLGHGVLLRGIPDVSMGSWSMAHPSLEVACAIWKAEHPDSAGQGP